MSVTVFTITDVLHRKSISCNSFVTVLTITDPLHKICDDFVTVLNDSPDIEQGSPLHKGDKESIKCNHEAAGHS